MQFAIVPLVVRFYFGLKSFFGFNHGQFWVLSLFWFAQGHIFVLIY